MFVCENNKYGMGTSAERSSMNTQYFTRGDQIAGLQVSRSLFPTLGPLTHFRRVFRQAFLVARRFDLRIAALAWEWIVQKRRARPDRQVNGMDILAVKQACAWAKEWTTSGNGPLVMEFVTYRYGGHS